ncbi:hypothetical protein FRC12_021224 [Ceratobasidium sp. 428]|nr:hypothetical protein FRC12_021224 [Ceratobasidium sp. 428]
MIRGVPRTNPPAPPPFTYNPRGAHATVSSPDEATSPISPVTNYIPGAGPIPPAPKPQPPPKRNSSSKSAPSVPIPPSIPEPNGVVPTQPVSQESSDESDGDDFFFDDKLLMSGLDDPFPTMPSELIGEPVVESGLLDMNEIDVPPTLATDFDQSVGAFVQPGVFADVEEIVTPGVSADSNNANYPAFDNGFGSVAPSVVFGPIAPYVQQNGMDAYSAYPNGEYTNWSNYNGYTYSDNMVPTMASTVSTPYLQSNGYGSPDSPPMLRSPTTGIEQDRLRNMLILYYFKHVRQMQYVFAGDVTTNVMLRHAQMDPQGVVSLALCSLAALHDSRMRIANGIMPNDQRARLPADKYYQKALTQLQGNKQRTGRLTDADATAALHFVSFW